MSIQWRDVSIPMRPGMTVWPGDPEFQFLPDARIAQHASCNTSILSFSTHAGTHCDAPWHFEENGRKLHEIDPAIFFGEALVMEFPKTDLIRERDLGKKTLPPRLLFKTRNSGYPIDAPFNTHFVGISPEAAQRVVDDGVRLVGVDYLSVAPYKQPGQATHHILLKNNVFVVEGLRLNGIPPGIHPFVVLPLPVMDADGAPCRAFIGVE